MDQTQYVLRNEKGLFGNFVRHGLLAECFVTAFEEAARTFEGGEAQTAEKALRILKSLPLGTAYVLNGEPKNARGWFPSAFLAARFWVSPESFVGESSRSNVFQSVQDCGWEKIGELAKINYDLNQLLIRAGCPVIDEAKLKGAAQILKRSKTWTFDPIDPIAELNSSSSWAIFKTTGYLDKDGGSGPLARARLYESAAAALRSAKAKGYHETNVDIAEIGVELKGITFPSSGGQTLLSAALAQVEAARLRGMLEKIGIDQLRARLIELEGQKPQTEETPPSPSRRRM